MMNISWKAQHSYMIAAGMQFTEGNLSEPYDAEAHHPHDLLDALVLPQRRSRTAKDSLYDVVVARLRAESHSAKVPPSEPLPSRCSRPSPFGLDFHWSHTLQARNRDPVASWSMQ
eukprot:scaffold2058_cov403-Prasinococcus_capsulatus_cf.AAC.5